MMDLKKIVLKILYMSGIIYHMQLNKKLCNCIKMFKPNNKPLEPKLSLTSKIISYTDLIYKKKY